MITDFDKQPINVNMDNSGLVKILQDNLNRYPENTVLRELLQNADDADATFMAVIYSPSKRQQHHPLLRDCAKLIVVNDGPVTQEQLLKMFAVRAGWQIGDDTKIGKFGYGMKSIFHWCDFGWVMQFVPGQNWSTNFVKAFGAPNLNLELVRDDNDDQVICNDVRTQLINHVKFESPVLFVLVLALRDDFVNEHLTTKCSYQPLKVGPFLSSEFVEQSHAPLANCLPCLSNLSKLITVVGTNTAESTLVVANIYSDSEPRLKRHSERKSRNFKSSGFVHTNKNGAWTGKRPYALTAVETNVPELTRIMQSDDWPTEPVTIDNVPTIVPEKGVHTGGVLLIGNGTNDVSLFHATYLPLQTVLASTFIGHRPGFDILLHGTFHTDSSRKQIIDIETPGVRCTWNSTLFYNVISPMVLSSINEHIDHLIPRADVEASSSVWTLIKQYRDSSREIFGHENFTKSNQLVFRVDQQRANKYAVIGSTKKVVYLPDSIVKNHREFRNFTNFTAKNVCTNSIQSCILSAGALIQTNLLGSLGLQSTTSIEILNHLCDQLTEDPNYIYSENDHIEIARTIREFTIRNHIPKLVEVSENIRNKCKVINIPERLAHYFTILYRPLISCFEPSTIFCRVKNTASFLQLNGPQIYKIVLDYISKGHFSDQQVVIHALRIELLRETENLHRHSFGLPVRDLATNELHLRPWKTTHELYLSGRIKFGHCESNRLFDQFVHLNASVSHCIEYLTRECLDELGFKYDIDIDKFVMLLNQVPLLSTCKHSRLKAINAIVNAYETHARKIELDQILLRLSHTSNQKKWIAIANKSTSQLIVELLQGLGHTVVSEVNSIRLISDCFPILVQHAISYPDNYCARFIRSEVIRSAIVDADESITRRLTIKDIKATRNELIRNNLQLNTLSKLPLVVTFRGVNVARSWATSGIVELSNGQQIPIILPAFEALFKRLRLDFIQVDGNLIKERDTAQADLILRYVIDHYFVNKPWSHELSTTLYDVLELFTTVGNVEITSIGEILRTSLLPMHLHVATTVRTDSCPPIIVNALVSVFGVAIFDGTGISVLHDICRFDSALFDLLIPDITPAWTVKFLLETNKLDEWNRYWSHMCASIRQPERQRLSEWVFSSPKCSDAYEYFDELPIHRSWNALYWSKTECSFPVAYCHYSWLPHIESSCDFLLQSKLAPTTELSEGQLFRYLCVDSDQANLKPLGIIVCQNLMDFRTVLDDAENSDLLSKLPFIEVNGTYHAVRDFLTPETESYNLDIVIADILHLRTTVPVFAQNLPIYKNTRMQLRDRVSLAVQFTSNDADSYALGTYNFRLEDIVKICIKLDKPKHRTIRFIKTLLDCEIISWEEKNQYVSKLLLNTRQNSYKAMVTVTHDVMDSGLEDAAAVRAIVIHLIKANVRTTKSDYFVPTFEGKWQPASETFVHGFNTSGGRLLLPSYGNEIPANLGSSAISDIDEYFEHDVWADFQSLKSATLAMLGLSTKTLEFAQSGLPTGVSTVDLTSGFERDRLNKVAFYVRHMNKKTRMQLCNGHFADIETSPDQLKSLVDHIDTTTDQTKVFLVLPTAQVDPNELRTLLLELAPSIYRELGMDAEECKGRLDNLSDDGQTTITETQQIALSRFQTTLQMIGQSRMPTELLKLAEELTDQQIRLGKSQSNILGRRQQGKSVQLDETELDLMERNIEIQATVVELLEKESTIHKQSVEAIRDATTRYSYDKLSFAFELIQNADDALEQLKDLDEFPAEDAEVIVDLSTGAFILAHSGRRINYFQNKERSIKKTKFKNDLVYMLTLNLTDKADVEVSSKDEQQYRPVTGKYGLGFKSVYHVTDDVKITSGELATEFRCGIWPKKLDSESRSLLDSWREHRKLPKSCTVIRLGGVTQVPKDFVDALVLLPLSTRNIRSIKFTDAAGKTTKFSCKSTKLTEHVNLIETTSRRKFLQVVGTDNYTWQCFELVDGLPVRVKDMSNYWVTVPTRVEHKPGFVCNAAFPLNSARTHVEHNDIMYVPFCSNFADVMAPAYRSLFRYLSNSKLKPVLGMNVVGTISDNEEKLRLGIEGILTSDNRLFEFLNLEGLPLDYQELAIQSLSRYTTSSQKTQMLADVRAQTSPSDDSIGAQNDQEKAQTSASEDSFSDQNDQEKDKSRPTESSIAPLFKNLRAVDDAWQQEMDGILYGNQMPNNWFEFITDFQTGNDHAREVWHRLILRSTFESVGVLRNAISCRGLLSSPYIRESIRLSRSKQGRQLLVESTEFMRKLVWDEDSKVSLDSGFYSGEIMKAAILTSELDEVVDHIELTLRDFSLVKYQNPRNNQGRHLLRGAIGSKASFFLLREVLRCFSRSNQWTQNLDKASNYAYVVSDPLARALECEQGDDTYRAQYINELFKRHCSIAPHEVGFDLQLRTKLGCL